MSATRKPAIASDDWMLEQQVRAELEAEAWRRLREELDRKPSPAAAAPAPAPAPTADPYRGGSAILKGLVRFALAAGCAYIAYVAALDSRLGEFEAWLAVGATFFVALSLSMFGAAREFVHLLAETARWAIIVAVLLGGAWMLMQMVAA